MLKQLKECLFRQLAFSASVVATSALFEEVRVVAKKGLFGLTKGHDDIVLQSLVLCKSM